MKKVLFAWELGAHYGHIAQLIPVARKLRKLGCEVQFALGDCSSAAQLLSPEAMPFLQAPMVRQPKNYPGAPASYPDILRRFGFGDATALHRLVLAWRALVKSASPDVIVLHSAPVAALATMGASARRVMLGMGWDVPPLEEPMRRFWPRANVSEAAIAAIQNEVELNVTAVLQALGEKADARLKQIFQADQRLLSTLPDLDHYPDRVEETTYAGPLFMDDAGVAAAYPQAAGPRIFVYLRDDTPHYQDVLHALGDKAGRYIAVLPNVDTTMRQQLIERGWQIHTTPIKLASIADATAIAITNGGHGVLSHFALKGVPCVVLPSNIDQLMLGARVAEAGLGTVLPPGASLNLTSVLDAWLGGTQSRDRLKAFKVENRNVSPATTAELMARCVIAA